MENKKVRDLARIAGIPLWKIGKEIGVSEPTFTRWMRIPLSDEKEKQILAAIEKLSEGREADA